MSLSADQIDVGHLPNFMVGKIAKENRARWTSTFAFVLAAVGSAVGLGNIWRFPYLVAKHGGAPFFIPYIVCLFLIGMPILLMELSLGQMFQGGDVEAFGRMHPRLRGIGLASVFASFTIVSYYAVVLSWATIYLVESFRSPLPYSKGLTVGNISFDSASTYFFDKILKLSANPEHRMSGEMIVALAMVWILIYFCIFKGVKTASWAVYVTVPLPVLLILIFLIKGATLEGAADGIKQYIGKWDASSLSSPTMWNEAMGQVFFTLSICMGVMTAYSSHNSVAHQLARDEKIISFSDMLIALVGGFTVYCMLGHLVFLSGDSAMYDISAFGLAFTAYPTGISLITGSNAWGVLFFLCLILLGIDSAFSMVEAVTTVVTDSWISKRYNLGKPLSSAFVCTAAFIVGIVYTMDSGLYFLDVTDHYVNSWGMIFVGFLETASLGWVYKSSSQQKVVGRLSVFVYNMMFFLALVVGMILALSIPTEKYIMTKDPTGSGVTNGTSIDNLKTLNTRQFALSITTDSPNFTIPFEEESKIDYIEVYPRFVGSLGKNFEYPAIVCLEWSSCQNQLHNAIVEAETQNGTFVELGTIDATTKEKYYVVINRFNSDEIFKSVKISLNTNNQLGIGGMSFIKPHASGLEAGAYAVPVGVFIWGLGLITSLILADPQVPFMKRLWGIVGWYGPDRLRKMINTTDGNPWQPMTLSSELKALYSPHLVSVFFSFYIKYLIPIILWVLFFITFKEDFVNRYSGYSWGYQSLGLVIFMVIFMMVVVVAIFPRVMLDPMACGKHGFWNQLKWAFTPLPSTEDTTAIFGSSEVYHSVRGPASVNSVEAANGNIKEKTQSSDKEVKPSTSKELQKGTSKELEKAKSKELRKGSSKEMRHMSSKEFRKNSEKDLARHSDKDCGNASENEIGRSSQKELGQGSQKDIAAKPSSQEEVIEQVDD